MMPVLECQCASLRRASRAVTRLYDAELRPAGLRVTQFTLLQALERAGPIAQGDLAHALGIDTTTLTRTLGGLEAEGWVTWRQGEDRRVREWRLAPEGRRAYERGVPHWERAQGRLRAIMGERDFRALIQLAAGVAALAE